MKTKTSLIAIFLCVFPLWQCFAAEEATSASNERAIDITLENDVFFHTDHYYTDGFQIETRLRDKTHTGEMSEMLEWMCHGVGCDAKSVLHETRIKVGQLMYTPSDIRVAAPQPYDHPWGGLLYTSLEYPLLSLDGKQLTTFIFEVGVTGPKSFAEGTQKWIHGLCGCYEPKGWDNQIGGTLGILASVERRFAWDTLSAGGGEDGSWMLRSDRYWKLTAGNIFTYAAVGIGSNVGKNLADVGGISAGTIRDKAVGARTSAADASAGAISPWIAYVDLPIGDAKKPPTSSHEDAPQRCLFSWLTCSFFSNLEVRAMAYNAFFDGSLPYASRVTPKPLVADLSMGIKIGLPKLRNTWLGAPLFGQFKVTRRTPEFDSVMPASSETVGALTIGTDF